MNPREAGEARRPITADDLESIYEPWELVGRRSFELLAGEIHEAPAPSPPHGSCVANLTRLFVTRLAERAIVHVQDAIELSQLSVPQPDLVLLAWREHGYAVEPPGPGDILLVVEVSRSSYRKDRKIKLPIYAAAGVPEVWIVHLETETLETHGGPVGERYRTTERFRRGERVAPRLLPDVALEVSEILPWTPGTARSSPR